MRERLVRRTLGAAIALWAASGISEADDFDYSGFSSGAGLRLLNDATVVGQRLRLTDGVLDARGAAWHETPVDVRGGFETSFTFLISEPIWGGADGFVFVIQNASLDAIGPLGCFIGYSGIPNSVAIEFDRYQNTACSPEPDNDPDFYHISVHTRGAAPNDVNEAYSIALAPGVAALADYQPHTVRIRVADGLLRLFLDEDGTALITTPIELEAELDLTQGRAWVGFTAATGGAAERYEILDWSLTELGQRAADAYPPAMPDIREPPAGRTVNPADVHMECAPLRDHDGDAHVCTDWEIWTGDFSERVWRAACTTGPSAVHIHLGDGAFEGSHAGRTSLEADRVYAVVVRHYDDGPAGRRVSRDARRRFRTAVEPALRPLVAQDVLDGLGLMWRTIDNQLLELPAGTAPARLWVEADDDRLLEIVGREDSGNLTNVFGPGEHPHTISLSLRGGSEPMKLPASQLSVWFDACRPTTIYFPAISMPPDSVANFWVSESGATFARSDEEEHPNLTQPLRAPTLPWVALRSDLRIERVAGDFQLPVNIVFIPNAGTDLNDPYFYVVELYGSIRVVTRSGATRVFVENLLNFDPTGPFPGSGEVGLAGLAIDPDTGDLYASMVFAAVDGDPAAGLFAKVDRLMSVDGGRTMASRSTVIELREQPSAPSHQISNVTIGPDGLLYVHVGDGFRTVDARNLDSFLGKIIRTTLDGAPVPTNPFYDSRDGITARDYVWCYGLRNPFGGAWRRSKGQHFFVENGSTVDRFAMAVAGRDYLWDGTEASTRNFALHNWFPAHAPVNIAFIEPQVFDGSGFSGEFFGKAYVTESGPTWGEGPQTLGKRIVQFDVAADGQSSGPPVTLVEYVGVGRATAVALAAGPDGLYFSDLYKDLDYLSPIDRGANVYRISYAPPLDCNASGRSDLCEIAENYTLDGDASGFIDSCELNKGDMNCDEKLDFFDIRPFVIALLDPDGYALGFAGCTIENADMNFDGGVNVSDIGPFVRRFLTFNGPP